MNKNDKKLILFILMPLILIILIIKIFDTKNNKIAYVYYEDEIVLKVDLNKKNKQEFDVQGFNGNVHIIAINGQIKVANENSKNHLCSKQGYISSNNQTIVCLPNKITIKINNTEYDTILR